MPTAALRTGDFSSVPVPLIDPVTQQPFPGNQIPASRISPSAQALLRFIPLPNLDGAIAELPPHRHVAVGAATRSTCA